MSDLELIKTDDEKKESLQAELVELEKKLNEKTEDLEKKKYLIEYTKDDIYNLRVFLKTKAKWQSSQALGIVEALKVLDEAETYANKNKIKGIMLNNIPIEAIAYFLSKHEDVGSEYASVFISMFKPIFVVRERLVSLRTEIDKLKGEYSKLTYAIENNINIEEATAKLTAEEVINNTQVVN